MRQRAARVGGDFARGLWAIPSYPTRQAARGTRAAARAAWHSPGPRRVRKHMRRRVVTPMQAYVARRLKRSRKIAKKHQRYYLRKWLPRQGRRLMVPARWVRRHTVDDAAWYRAQLARAGAWAHRRRRVWRVRVIRRARALRVRVTPNWWVQLRTLAAVNGRAALFMTAFTASVAAVAHFFRDVLPEWVLHGRRRVPAPVAAPVPAPAPRPAPAQPQPQPQPRGARPGTPQPAPATATPRPVPVFTPAPPTPATAGAAPAAGGNPAMAAKTDTAINIGIPAGIHPSLSRILEASYKVTATWRPKSPPDLHVYLESQPDALNSLSDIHRQFGDRLAATFPGVTLVHSFFAQVAHGYAGLQGEAYDLFRGWEMLHAADLARFRSPRVNEAYSDVARHGVNVANVPALDNGHRWHANHTVLIEVTRSQLFGLQWTATDKVAELMTWIDGLPLFFDCLCRHTLAMGRYLVQNMPVEPRLGDFYRQLGRGYLGLADQADELAAGYRARNRNDVDRRERPRPQEEWFDFSNQAVTAA